jgi:hypothetical protein
VRRFFRGAVSAAVGIALLATGQTSASATVQYAQDHFVVQLGATNLVEVVGYITWGQRTADIQGYIDNTYGIPPWDGSATAYFDAFAGTTKVDSETRTAQVGSFQYPIHFSIGDPNRVGGIDRIRTQICVQSPTTRTCSDQWNDIRD